LSGDAALSIAKKVFRSHRPNNEGFHEGIELHSHRMHYGHIVDPESGRKIDEVLMVYMRAPKTYTREDVIEINAHGGAVALKAILELALRHGARLAAPGEFTLRAFLNGRIDLTQAEAIMDVINARTERALTAAAQLVAGEMKTRVQVIRDAVDGIAAEIEAAIDFPEEIDFPLDNENLVRRLKSDICFPLQELISNYQSGRILREGVRMAIIGRPNVGKSSLLNRLLQQERAIVTEYPGTTRDAIEATLDINGIPIRVADTAGLRASADPIEIMGIRKAEEHIRGADVLLFMVEGHRPPAAEDYQIYEKYKCKQTIVVRNKMDLAQKEGNQGFFHAWNTPQVAISALYGNGMEELKSTITEVACRGEGFGSEESIMPNLRQKVAMENALRAAQDVLKGLSNGMPLEFASTDLKTTAQHLARVCGETEQDDLLDRIFSRYCIGK
jgi:tRNA modification GTPase